MLWRKTWYRCNKYVNFPALRLDHHVFSVAVVDYAVMRGLVVLLGGNRRTSVHRGRCAICRMGPDDWVGSWGPSNSSFETIGLCVDRCKKHVAKNAQPALDQTVVWLVHVRCIGGSFFLPFPVFALGLVSYRARIGKHRVCFVTTKFWTRPAQLIKKLYWDKSNWTIWLRNW